jgi:predicted transcriptional regulator
MAHQSHRRIALLSIHPRHAKALLEGKKTVELRRTRFPSDVSHVVVYATSPMRTIVGWFEVRSIERDRPWRLWIKHGSATGVTRREFRSYFDGAEEGTAISVRRAVALKSPLALSMLWSSPPPQSFSYLDSKLAGEVLGLAAG